MPNPSALTFGFELEYASNARRVVELLYAQGVTKQDHLHRYHCDCNSCAVSPGEVYSERTGGYIMRQPADIHCQTDSTADGEFISRILNDWDDLARIAAALTAAATAADATTSFRCGLHVHVGGFPSDARVAPNYLAFERYFTEIIAPGRAQQKRDMNSTLMQSYRQYVADGYTVRHTDAWKDVGRAQINADLLGAIGRDRHVDLNFSRNNQTWEFRVFNATNAAWRIELACRLAVAFVAATPALSELIETAVRGSDLWPAGCDSPWGEIARPAWSALTGPHPTKRPIVPMQAFVDALCAVDPDLVPLIERQINYMRARYAAQVEFATV